MIRLLYFSTAVADISPADVDAIVATSADNNARSGITGALTFNGRNFCQCLEGEEADVRALVATIEKDTRHAGMKVIDEKPITERHFPDWSMIKVDGLNFVEVIDAMKA